MHSFAPFSNLNFFVKNCWNFCWFLKNFAKFARILLNFLLNLAKFWSKFFGIFPKCSIFLKNSEKCCKIAISVKNEARMKLVCMYQLPQTPPPPSTSNFIPELPRLYIRADGYSGRLVVDRTDQSSRRKGPCVWPLCSPRLSSHWRCGLARGRRLRRLPRPHRRARLVRWVANN